MFAFFLMLASSIAMISGQSFCNDTCTPQHTEFQVACLKTWGYGYPKRYVSTAQGKRTLENDVEVSDQPTPGIEELINSMPTVAKEYPVRIPTRHEVQYFEKYAPYLYFLEAMRNRNK